MLSSSNSKSLTCSIGRTIGNSLPPRGKILSSWKIKLIAELKRQSAEQIKGYVETFNYWSDDLERRTKNTQKVDALAGIVSALGVPGLIIGFGISAANTLFKRDIADEVTEDQEWFNTQVAPFVEGLEKLEAWEIKYAKELSDMRTKRVAKYILGGYVASQLI